MLLRDRGRPRSGYPRSGRPRSGSRAPVALIRRLALCPALLVCLAGVPARAVAGGTTPFGIASFSTQTTEARAPGVNEPYTFTQDGGHPWALTSTVDFTSEEAGSGYRSGAGGDPKDVIVDLPPGLIADPQAVARCSAAVEHCPTDAQVGVFELHFVGAEGPLTVLGAIVNMTPHAGQAAELGLEVPILGRVLLVGRLVRGPQGYGLAIVGRGLPTLASSTSASGSPAVHLASMETTLWGVPAAAVHDPQRGISCLGVGMGLTCQGGGLPDGEEAVPFLTMPSNCSGAPLSTVAWADSWDDPGRYAQAESTLPAMAGCERSRFSPEVTVNPDTAGPEQPVGIDLGIEVPQFSGSTVAAPALRSATVTLPQGVSINAGVADGLQGCGASGPAGIDIPTGLSEHGDRLQPGEVGPGEEIGPGGEPELAPGHCPDASIVGTAEATTPLLAHPIAGRVYIAAPGCGAQGQECTDQDAADGNLYRLYVELDGGAGELGEGLIIKLAATVQANPATGQLTVGLSESPQVPLSELKLHLRGGERALLANPTTCGAATTSSILEPWSAPFTPNASPSSYYEVTGCAAAPLKPGFLAGSVNAIAGAPTAFTLTVTRGAGEPYLAKIQAHTPPGLSAKLSGVSPCEESLAATGACAQASRIGTSEVAAGAGSQPLYMPGDIYLTGPYEGAPFGLSIVTNAQAGPLSLGRVVIRARIDIDPATAELTITTDPLPQIVLGVPLRIQLVSLALDRPDFILNPTSCDVQQVDATVAGTVGTSARVSNRFALTACKGLAFKPKLDASTNAHTSLAGGASLDVKLTSPKAEPGTQANIAQVKLTLPKQFSTRLTALQSACLQATFDADPASCPAASVIGIARARAPLLLGPLMGPVYLVTRGHDALPSPIVVVQGQGVTLELRGSTTIGKAGTASIAFDAIPDVPMESLEVYMPRGPRSLLDAGTSLCALGKTVTVKREILRRAGGRTVRRTVNARERIPASLPMATELVAHNGARVRQTTKIAVSGCPVEHAKTPRRRSTGQPAL
jgi:hypothetical protein